MNPQVIFKRPESQVNWKNTNNFNDLQSQNLYLKQQLKQALLRQNKLKYELEKTKHQLSKFHQDKKRQEIISIKKKKLENSDYYQQFSNSSDEKNNSQVSKSLKLLKITSQKQQPMVSQFFKSTQPLATPTKLIFSIFFTLFRDSEEGKQTPKIFNRLFKKNQLPNSVSSIDVLKLSNKSKSKHFHKFDEIRKDVSLKHKDKKNDLQSLNKIKQSPNFSSFFITNYTFQPVISYCYPKKSPHFDAILALCYAQCSNVKLSQISPSNSLKKLNSSKTSLKSTKNIKSSYKIRDTFVIPLRCQGSLDQRQYLLACQTDQLYNLNHDYETINYPRYFCFITSCKFFMAYKEIIQQFLNILQNSTKKKQQKQPTKNINEEIFINIVKDELQLPLSRLMQESLQQNNYKKVSLGPNLYVYIDIPPFQDSYKSINQFKSWDILSLDLKVINNQNGQKFNTKLFGILIIYLLIQSKIVLFSSVKSKISQAVIHVLEIIKPLHYVNPVMIAAIKQSHQEYLNAPISLLLGLWSEPRKSNKQKLQIYMNRKQDMQNLIEKGILEIIGGIVINLDTGTVYGGDLKNQYNKIGNNLNKYYELHFKQSKNIFKLFERMLGNNSESTQIRQLWKQIEVVIEKTQLYCYYREKMQIKNSKSKIQ